MHVAQTNVELYRQLHDDGWADTDVAEVARAYEMVCGIAPGVYRRSGRPVLCHMVGTASVLAASQQSMTLVLAGLLHVAFGTNGRLRERPRLWQNRRRVTNGFGREVTTRAERMMEVEPADVPRFAGSSDPVDRDAAVIRLCDRVDELHDNLGPYFSGWEWIPGKWKAVGDGLLGAARDLGLPLVEAELQAGLAALAETSACDPVIDVNERRPRLAHVVVGSTWHPMLMATYSRPR